MARRKRKSRRFGDVPADLARAGKCGAAKSALRAMKPGIRRDYEAEIVGDLCSIGPGGASFSGKRRGRGFSGVKPAFKSGESTLITRAGFPTTIDSPVIVVEVRKGTKRTGFDHRYRVSTPDGRDFWASEEDLAADSTGEFRRASMSRTGFLKHF